MKFLRWYFKSYDNEDGRIALGAFSLISILALGIVFPNSFGILLAFLSLMVLAGRLLFFLFGCASWVLS